MLLTLLVFLPLAASGYRLGVGIADITGPPAEVPFMGYAKPEQSGSGLHTRQFARAFIIQEEEENGQSLVFVSADCGMMGTFLRKEVLKRLRDKLGGGLYTEENVMISGTHTHSTPGGFLLNFIFDLNSWGFVPDTFQAYASGITQSILRAHNNLVEGDLYFSQGRVEGASINRSPTAYLRNPPEERNSYEDNIDHTLSQLKFFRRGDGLPLGVLNWFAVHPTSMNNSNHLVSSDNVGLASVLFEQRINSNVTRLIGKGPFVAAFASTNLGDVSPNTAGPRCVPSGAPCDLESSACSAKGDLCIAFGPGKDMFQSTRIIAGRIMNTAWEVWKSRETRRVEGRLRTVHQFVHMPTATAEIRDPTTGNLTTVKGCLPAMGYSFAAGTTDGPGAFSFKQSTVTSNPLWNLVRDILAVPTQEMISCQAPKPILLATGLMNFPYVWQPAIVSTQLSLLGDHLAIACVPGEFTTMSGRRLRRTLTDALHLQTPDGVIVAGLCNTYSDYITTFEEYQAQRYEGGSTIFGPHTLALYQSQYAKLAEYIKKDLRPPSGPTPQEDLNNVISLLPPVVWDSAGWGRNFGEVLSQPSPSARPGDTVSATFVSGHPRNNLQTESTYLTVERQLGAEDQWELIATDANWETRLEWKRLNPVLGTSTVDVRWEVPLDATPGIYRLRHFGHHKNFLNGVKAYTGVSAPFKITMNNS